jgi:dihydrodipicolinate synthase/N-acetylneuraminate lyase
MLGRIDPKETIVDVRGLYVALLTPLHPDGSLDLDGIAGHVERMLAGGVDGFVALGTTGEFADLTPPERRAVTEATLDAVAGRARVYVGVGAVGTAEACEHARSAADAGADGLLSLPPLYWKLPEDGLLAHFEQVAAATDLPLLLYDFPSLAGTALTPRLVDRVAREIPQVVGIKLSGPELRTAHAVLDLTKSHRSDFSVMLGAAELILPAMLAGADGTIAAIPNVDPRPVAGLLKAVAADDLGAAARHHRRILDLLAITALAAPPVLALKAAAQALGSPVEPHVRTAPPNPDDVVARARRLAGELS